MAGLNKLIGGLDGTISFESDAVEFKKKVGQKLISQSFLKLIDVISEGEIEGFPTPLKLGIERHTLNYKIACLADVFLGKTPILKTPTVPSIQEIIDNYEELGTLGKKKKAALSATTLEAFNFSDIVADFQFGSAETDDDGKIVNKFKANWSSSSASSGDTQGVITITNNQTSTCVPQIAKGDSIKLNFITTDNPSASAVNLTKKFATYESALVNDDGESIVTVTTLDAEGGSAAAHGFTADQEIYINFTSGTLNSPTDKDGRYKVKLISGNDNAFELVVGGASIATTGTATVSADTNDGFYKVIESDHKNEFKVRFLDTDGDPKTLAEDTGTVGVEKIANVPFTGVEDTELNLNFVNYGTIVTKNAPQSFQIQKSPLTEEVLANDPDSPGFNRLKVTLNWNAHFKVGSGGVAKNITKYRISIIDANNVEYDYVEGDNVFLTKGEKKGVSTDPSQIVLVGKTKKPFKRDHVINFGTLLEVGDNDTSVLPAFPITLKVERLNASTSKNEFSVSKISKLFDKKQKFSDLAVAALRFDGQAFNSVPSRMYRIRGMRVRIPDEDDAGLKPTVDINNGRVVYPSGYSFDGSLTHKCVWTTDPAWILLDVMLSKRYGIGDHIALSQVDLFSLYEISKYSSTLVPVGKDGIEGEMEPRFSLSATIRNREDAFKVIADITSVFRGFGFWSAGSLSFSQDRGNLDPEYLFNLSNVTAEGFSYSGTSLKTRANIVTVSYFDNETKQKAYVTVKDNAANVGSGLETFNKFGEVHKKVAAFGCTSKSQARRAANFILYENNRSVETVSFTTGLAGGVIVRPGMRINITDPMKAGLRRGGRLSVTNLIEGTVKNKVIVDDSANTSLPSSGDISIMITTPNADTGIQEATLETKSISSVDGNVITVSSDFTTKPEPNAEYLISDSTVSPTTWRVLTVTEDKDVYAITAISYDVNKYDFIENPDDGIPDPEPVTIINNQTSAPTGLELTEEFYSEEGKIKNKLIIEWNQTEGAKDYLVQISSPSQTDLEIYVNETAFTVFDAELGEYDVSVSSRNTTGLLSAGSADATKEIVGKTTPPDDLAGLTVEPVDKNFVRLAWEKSNDVTVINGGRVYIKHSNLTSGVTFQNSTPIVDAVPGTSTDAIVPKIAGTYVVKARDAKDTFSNGEQTVQFALDDSEADDQDTITNINEDGASFAGTKTGVAITSDGTGLEMILAGDGLFDDETDFDTLTPNLDQIGDTISTTGTYEFTTVGDLGANNKMPTHFIKEIAATTFLKNTEIDARNEIDLFSDIDGTKIDEPKVDLFVATTDDDPSSGSPTFTAFEKFSNATFKGRGYKFKAVFTSTKPDENIKVTTLRATGSLAPRTETQRDGTCVHTVNGDFVSSASAGTITVTPTTADITGAIVGTDILNGDTVNLTFTTSTLTGTYIATGGTTTIICNFTAHGFSAGDPVILDFTSGSATDGTYTVSASGLSTDRFFVTSATSLDTSGNVTLTIAKPDDGTYTVASVSGTTSFTVNDADAPLVTKSGQQCVTKKTMTPDNSGFIRSGAFGVTCTFAKRFKTPPTVNVFLGEASAQDLFFKPVAVTETEFTIRFGDAGASNLLKSLLFSYTATGFGKGDTS